MAQDADREARRAVNHDAGLGVLAEAEQHERGIERQRRKRVRRHRPDLAIDLHRDHRHAGHETPYRLSERSLVYGHRNYQLPTTNFPPLPIPNSQSGERWDLGVGSGW